MDSLLAAIKDLLSDSQLIWIALIVLLALFTKAAIGFGDGVIAVPLLSLFMELSEAVPFILFLSTFMSIIPLWRDRSHIQVTSLKRTASMALLGFPFGVMLLGLGNDVLVKSILGFLLVILALWYFVPSRKLRLKSGNWSYFFGILAGVLGGAYAMRGIIFSIYGSLRGWTAAEFKSTIHSFYLLNGLLIPFAYFFAELATYRVLGLFILMLPVAVCATFLGVWCSDKLDAQSFQNLIWAALMLFGLFFIGQYFYSIF